MANLCIVVALVHELTIGCDISFCSPIHLGRDDRELTLRVCRALVSLVPIHALSVHESRCYKIPKAKYWVSNWQDYDAELVCRGSLTV